MEDCYYFLYSNCSKPNCEFRHNINAKENPILCKTWKLKKQCKIDCPFRHSTYHLNKKRHEMMCYWETTTGCTKQFCEFRHEDVQKDMWKESRVKSLNEIIGRKSNVEENRRNEHEEDKRDEYGIEMQRNDLHNDRREEPNRETQRSELQYDRRDNSNFEPQNLNESKTKIERNAVNGDVNQIGNVFDAQRRDFTSSHKKGEERHAKGNESVYARHAFAKRKNNKQQQRNESNYADEEWNLQEELLLTANDANKTFGPDTISESLNEQKREDSSIMQLAQEHTANTSNSHTNNPNTSFFVDSTVVSTQTLDVDDSALEIESDAIINKLKTGKRRIEDSSTTKRLKWREKIELLERNLKAAKKKSICTIKDAIEDGEKE